MHGCFSDSHVHFMKCVMSAGVAVKVKRPSGEIMEEDIMATQVFYSVLCDYNPTRNCRTISQEDSS